MTVLPVKARGWSELSVQQAEQAEIRKCTAFGCGMCDSMSLNYCGSRRKLVLTITHFSAVTCTRFQTEQ